MASDEAQSAFYAASEEVLSAAEAYKFMKPAFGKDVVYDCPDKKFQEQRKYGLPFPLLLTLRFLSKSLLNVPAFRKMVGIIHDETVSYLDETWKEKGSLDFYSDVGEMIIRTSTQYAFAFF